MLQRYINYLNKTITDKYLSGFNEPIVLGANFIDKYYVVIFEVESGE